ncbi:MAG: protease complex subunit PrcB family protein [Gammaproteobacteria bacterium]
MKAREWQQMLCTIWRLTIAIVPFFFVTSTFGATEGNGKLEYQLIAPDKSFFPSYSWPKVPAYIAVHSAAEWVAFWSVRGRLSLPVPNVGQLGDDTLHIPDPDVDFDRFTLLLITDGPKPTPGYSTAISSIWEGPKILVTVINVRPVFENNCATAQVVTTPTVVALIPKANKPIEFDVIEATTSGCGGHSSRDNGA